MVTLGDFGELTEAENKLIGWLQAGDRRVCKISKAVPPADTDKVCLRASLVRELALGKVEGVPLPETGLRVQGAWVSDEILDGVPIRGLDFQGCNISASFALLKCQLNLPLLLRGARVRSIWLDGSDFRGGLAAERLVSEGHVSLSQVKAQAPVSFTNGQIAGNLNISRASFTARSRVATSVRCHDDHPSDDEHVALDLRAISVKGILQFSPNTHFEGPLDLRGATVGLLDDRHECWPEQGNLRLGRFTYKGFTEEALCDAPSRIRWLALQKIERYDSDQKFHPQPYEECARALREAGHGSAARAVLIEKERLQRAARRKIAAEHFLHGDVFLMFLWDGFLRVTIQYGRQPMLAFAWLAGFWVLGAVVFAIAEEAGALKPNLPQVQRAPEWVLCGQDAGEMVDAASLTRGSFGLRAPGQTQYACFRAQPEAKSYPHFNAAVYSADTLIPVVSFEMQSYWLPDDSTPVGKWVRIYLWLQIVSGWGLTLLAVAGFSGLVKQDSK
jgi:hypothetical protein